MVNKETKQDANDLEASRLTFRVFAQLLAHNVFLEYEDIVPFRDEDLLGGLQDSVNRSYQRHAWQHFTALLASMGR